MPTMSQPGKEKQNNNRKNNWSRTFRASVRDTLILLNQFRLPLFAFIMLILMGGELYFRLSQTSQSPVPHPVEAIYHILGLVFLQPIEPFPPEWYLQVFYFVTPILGIAIVAQGLTDFGVLFFNKRARSKEWEVAVASTFRNHVVLVGMGHLGYRVIDKLTQMGQEVVVIDVEPNADLLEIVRNRGIPVLVDDATRISVLQAAGVIHAKAIIVCIQQDGINLHIALKARSLNPKIEVVVRIFDDDFADALASQFGFRALSATGMAAPAFAAAAAGIDMTKPITVEGQSLSLARLEINQSGHLVNMPVEAIEKEFNVSIVLLKRGGEADLHPTPERCLIGGDKLAILGGPAEITRLSFTNQSPRD